MPAGDWEVKGELRVPKGITLRGVSRGGSVLRVRKAIVLASNTTLQELTVVQLNGNEPAVPVGGGEALRNVAIRRCRFVCEQGPPKHTYRYCAVVVSAPVQGLTIRDSRLEGRYLIGIFADTERAHALAVKPVSSSEQV